MLLTGLDWKYFNWQQMEFFGKLNLLKTGLVFADAINTVSPRYAEEIQTAPLGCGLEGVLQHRRDVLSGILNGVDYRQWNPATDPHLPAKYDAAERSRRARRPARRRCKRELGLPQDPQRAARWRSSAGWSSRKGSTWSPQVMQEWVHHEPTCNG